MSRKSYRRGVPPREQPSPEPKSPAAVRRYTPRAKARAKSPLGARFTDESQYVHVRQDLLRIAILSAILFGALVLLRLASTFLGLLP